MNTLRSTRTYCKRNGIECTLTADEAISLYESQQGKCALTGRGLIFGSKGQQRDSLSIDQIEHRGGYVLGNVGLITYQANFARNKFSDDELFAFCEAVLATRAVPIEVLVEDPARPEHARSHTLMPQRCD